MEKKISPLLLKKVRKEFERVARLLCCQDESRKCGELHNMFDPRILHASHFGVRGNLGTRNWYFISDESVFAALNEFLFYISGFVLYFSLVLGFYIL